MEKTNQQTSEQKKIYDKSVSEKAKESIILKGIATSINSMAFPQFENLHEMLLHFNLGLDVENLKNDEGLNNLLIRNKKFLSEMINHDYQIMEDEKVNGSITNLVKSHTAKEKKFKLITNLAYSDINFDEKKTFECINLISSLPTVGVATLPIFKHCGHSYSVGENVFNNINEILKIIVSTEFDFIVYLLYVTENIITMRWAVADK
jgi:hypothetical protein